MKANKREIIYSVKKVKGMTAEKLRKIMKKWQSALLLKGWNLSLKIVEFRRRDYKQSGDIKVNLKNKEAIILLTSDPFKDEEEVIVHELVHLLLWDFDTFSERVILKHCGKSRGDHIRYMDKLEATVKSITDILLKNRRTGRSRDLPARN